MRTLPFKYDEKTGKYVELLERYKFNISESKDFLDVFKQSFDKTGNVVDTYLESYSLDFLNVKTDVVEAFNLIMDLSKTLIECDEVHIGERGIVKRYNFFRFFDPYCTEAKMCFEIPKCEFIDELMKYPSGRNVATSNFRSKKSYSYSEEVVNLAIGLLTVCDNKTLAAYQYMCEKYCEERNGNFDKFDIYVENDTLKTRNGMLYIAMKIPALYKDYKDMWKLTRSIHVIRNSHVVPIGSNKHGFGFFMDSSKYTYKLYRYIISGKQTRIKNKIMYIFDIDYFLNPNSDCVFCDKERGIHAISYLGEQGYRIAKLNMCNNFKEFKQILKNRITEYSGCKRCSIKRKEQILFITLKY